MRVAIVSFLLALAASAAGNDSRTLTHQQRILIFRLGIVITSPQRGEKVDFSKPFTIEWQSFS